ncbi:hypothetical protein HOJ75_02205 [Candidatus Woesearchaeota archaeon]|nr:hypothetical protein [Candidatus Woesearchaeota archaeon]
MVTKKSKKTKRQQRRNSFIIIIITIILIATISLIVTTINLVGKAGETDIINCGFSDLAGASNVTYQSEDGGMYTIWLYDEFEELVCFGDALINNCQKAKFSIQSEVGTINLETKGLVDEFCNFKIEFDEISSEYSSNVPIPDFSKTYMECPLLIEDIRANNCSFPFTTEVCNEFDLSNSPGHTVMNLMSNLILVSFLGPQLLLESNCSGTFLDLLLEGEESQTGLSYYDLYDDICLDPDNENVSVRGDTIGIELEQTSMGTYQEKRVLKSDGCFNETHVVEQTCGENDYIVSETVQCPPKTFCSEGACIDIIPVVSISDISKSVTELYIDENITVPFSVITQLYDENGTVIVFNKVLYPSAQKDDVIQMTVTYDTIDTVKQKSVTVYDVPDPSVWKVYLNETFVAEYDNSE